MRKRKRKHFNKEFKLRMSLAGLRNGETVSDIASRFGTHPAMINIWIKLFRGPVECLT